VGVTNTGLLTATGGGTLQLSTVVANAGANITANGGTVIVGNPFNNFVATINGGTLTSTAGGTLETQAGNTAVLNGVTLAAGTTYINPADSNLLVSGTITNDGDIQINANGGAASNLQVTANTTLSGLGTVTLSYNNALFNDASILGAVGLTLLTPVTVPSREPETSGAAVSRLPIVERSMPTNPGWRWSPPVESSIPVYWTLPLAAR
jgi:hypothetical protein